jgi:hypothetical protein
MKKGTRADRRRKQVQLSCRVCPVWPERLWRLRLFRDRDHAISEFDATYTALQASLAEHLSKLTTYLRVNPPGTIDLIKTQDGTYE